MHLIFIQVVQLLKDILSVFIAKIRFCERKFPILKLVGRNKNTATVHILDPTSKSQTK